MVVLQNSTNSENVLVAPYGEMYSANHDANQAMDIKTEEVSDAQEGADPVQITFQEMKAEPEVSLCFCMLTVRQISQICRIVNCLSPLHISISIYLSVCAHETIPLYC
jgi:hypothetical protein